LSKNDHQINGRVAELRQRRDKIKLGGGKAAIAKQHQSGRLTAREKIARLWDPGTFTELDIFASSLGQEFGMAGKKIPADGIIIGHGKIDGRPVAGFATDYTCMAGTFGEMHGRKMTKIIEFAMKTGMPLVSINESGGARLQEDMGPLSQYGRLYYTSSLASGVIPQIALATGVVAGGQAFALGLHDFVFMVKDTSYAFLGGPPLIEAVTGEKTTIEELGTARMHSTVSGACHLVAKDENEIFLRARELLSYLPSNNRGKPLEREVPPYLDTGDSPARTSEKLYDVIPSNRETAYDIHHIIHEIVDNGDIFELHKDFSKEMLTGFARLGGYSVGIVANNPMFLAGAITVPAAEKAARFKRFCDCFNLPIINIVDSPAYVIDPRQERMGMIYKGAKLYHATAEATVPQITLYIGKAYAGGYVSMGSKDMGVDFAFAWPTAEIALVSPQGTVNVVYRKEIAAAANPAAERQKLEQEFRDTYLSIYSPAAKQHIDDIIDPKDTRQVLFTALETLKNKVVQRPWKKYGNIPL